MEGWHLVCMLLCASSSSTLVLASPPLVTKFFVHVVREAVDDQLVTSIPFLEIPATTPFALGYPSAFDNKITAGPEYDSKELGRSQGVFIITHRLGINSTITMNLNFYGHNGYLYTAGAFDFSTVNNTMLVLGGTGEFKDVRGYYNVRLVRRYPEYSRSNSLLYGELDLLHV